MAEGTPESDLGSCDCFQNYTASEVFVHGLAGVVNQQDVEAIIRAQKQMLQRFEKTNEMLVNCNALSSGRLQSATQDFRKHTNLLLEMRRDLEGVFKRIRVLKTKLHDKYPQAFTAIAACDPLPEEEDECDQSDLKDLSNDKTLVVEEGTEAPPTTPINRVKRSGSSSTESQNSNVSDHSQSSTDT